MSALPADVRHAFNITGDDRAGAQEAAGLEEEMVCVGGGEGGEGRGPRG